MGLGQSAECHAEQIPCERSNRNMLFSIHNKAVINFIRENDQLVLSCEIYNLLQYFLRIKSTGRIVWIDDNDRFCTVIDLLTHIFDIRIPVRLLITDIVHRLSTGKCSTSCPERIIRGRDQNLISCIQKSRHRKIDQFTDTISCVNIAHRYIRQVL